MKRYITQIINSQKVFMLNFTFMYLLVQIVFGFSIYYSYKESSIIPLLIIGLPYLFMFESVRNSVFGKFKK